MEGKDSDTVESHIDQEGVRLLRQKASVLDETSKRIEEYLDGEFNGDMKTLDVFLEEVMCHLTNTRNTISLVRASYELEGHEDNVEEEDEEPPELKGGSSLSGDEPEAQEGSEETEPTDADSSGGGDEGDDGGADGSELDEDLNSLY